MSEDPHTGFIIAAYAIAFVVIAGMVAAILIDHIGLKHALSRLSHNRSGSEE